MLTVSSRADRRHLPVVSSTLRIRFRNLTLLAVCRSLIMHGVCVYYADRESTRDRRLSRIVVPVAALAALQVM